MRPLSLLIAFVLVLSSPVSAPTQTTSSPQPTTLLQQSFTAMVGNTSLSDITISGTARRIAGSDDETGTATLKAVYNGSARVDFTFPSGARSEVANFYSAPAGSWSGPDGASHPAAFHNLLGETAWFFPAFGIARRLSGSNYVASYIGEETLNGVSVLHISVSQTAPTQVVSSDPVYPHLTQLDFYLDPETLLPAALMFNVHPDSNELLDIPVEVDFSNYQVIDGLRVPTHVQKSLNGSITLDFKLQSVSPNTGLSASSFSL